MRIVIRDRESMEVVDEVTLEDPREAWISNYNRFSLFRLAEIPEDQPSSDATRLATAERRESSCPFSRSHGDIATIGMGKAAVNKQFQDSPNFVAISLFTSPWR